MSLPKKDDYTLDGLRLMVAYAGPDVLDRRETTEKHTLIPSYEGDKPLSEFMNELTTIWASMPEDAREHAVVEMNDSYLAVTWARLETDEEVTERVERATNYANRILLQERETYERLKSKFRDMKKEDVKALRNGVYIVHWRTIKAVQLLAS